MFFQAKTLEKKLSRGRNEPDKRFLTADNSRPRVNQYTNQPWENILRQPSQQPNPSLPEEPISQKLGQQRQLNVLKDSFSSRRNQLSGSADNQRENSSPQNDKLRQATIPKRTNSLDQQDFESSPYDRSYDGLSLPNVPKEEPYQGFNRQRASSSRESFSESQSSDNLLRNPENSYVGYNSEELNPDPKTRSPLNKVLIDSKGQIF